MNLNQYKQQITSVLKSAITERLNLPSVCRGLIYPKKIQTEANEAADAAVEMEAEAVVAMQA